MYIEKEINKQKDVNTVQNQNRPQTASHKNRSQTQNTNAQEAEQTQENGPQNANPQQQNGQNSVEKCIEPEPITTATMTISYVDDPNSRYEVYPNKNGIYEYKTEPGEYKLEIVNQDCEKIIKKIKLDKGLNETCIKMHPAKHCDLVIEVLEYNEREQRVQSDGQSDGKIIIETLPVRNAEVQIFKDGDNLIKEGITNRKGIMKYLVDKNENSLSIKIAKNGYFGTERSFKRSDVMQENEKGI